MGNTASNYSIIRVTPTLSTDAYGVDDVLFTGLEIPGAVKGDGGCSMLLSAYLLDQSDTADIDIDFYFTEESTALGTINATADVSDADMEAIGFCGSIRCDADHATSGNNIDGVRLHQLVLYDGASVGNLPLTLLQAKSGSTSVYCHAIVTGGTPTYAADDLDLILHIQYK
tara:strand:+ start:5219 stop:5731 length:513 start_codon:yes stop_codon:yes gene_type:complete